MDPATQPQVETPTPPPLVGTDMDAADFGTGSQTGEEFTADFRQQRVGNERIHHAGATLELATAFGNEFRDRVVVAKRNLVVFLNTFLNTGEV